MRKKYPANRGSEPFPCLWLTSITSVGDSLTKKCPNKRYNINDRGLEEPKFKKNGNLSPGLNEVSTEAEINSIAEDPQNASELYEIKRSSSQPCSNRESFKIGYDSPREDKIDEKLRLAREYRDYCLESLIRLKPTKPEKPNSPLPKIYQRPNVIINRVEQTEIVLDSKNLGCRLFETEGLKIAAPRLKYILKKDETKSIIPARKPILFIKKLSGLVKNPENIKEINIETAEHILSKGRGEITEKNEQILNFLRNRSVSYYIDEALNCVRRRNIPEEYYKNFKKVRDKTLIELAKLKMNK